MIPYVARDLVVWGRIADARRARGAAAAVADRSGKEKKKVFLFKIFLKYIFKIYTVKQCSRYNNITKPISHF